MLFLIMVLFSSTLFARNPFEYDSENQKNILATARFEDADRRVIFSMNEQQAMQVSTQEKSPSTLEKAEGLGG